MPHPFSRNQPDPAPARTALAMLAMTCSFEQLASVENSLLWAPKNRPPAGSHTHALNELQLVLQAVREEER